MVRKKFRAYIKVTHLYLQLSEEETQCIGCIVSHFLLECGDFAQARISILIA